MRLLDLFRRKESLARSVSTIQQIGQAQSTPANYENFAKVGYGRSIMVYRCVSMIAAAAKGMKFDLYDKTNPKKPREVLEHPLLKLWNKPNPMQSTADFIENMVAFYVLDGNSYVEANGGALKSKIPLEIWNVRPDKMKVVPGPKGYPQAYRFTSGQSSKEWPVDLVTMKSQILHWKTFHPLNDWYGMSPLEAAMYSLDQNLAGQQWNLALLQNAATPSGILQVQVTDANPGGTLTEEQYTDLKRDIDEKYTGVKNAGRPMLLEGGINWQQMSIAPKDMDYAKGKVMTATDIAIAFGIPPELLGLGEKTFNNYREARLSFYEETVLPIMDSAMSALNRWLGPSFENENLCLEYDKDDIEVLQWKREQRYTSLQTTNFLTQNEKREAVGYEKQEGWDVYVIGNQVGALPEDFSGGTGDGTEVDPNEDPDKPDSEDVEDDVDGDVGDEPDDSEDETDEGDDDDAEEAHADHRLQWKSINLVSAREKRLSWKRQNQKRKTLAKAFDKDVYEDFKELTKELTKIDGNHRDAKLTEYALMRVISEFMPTMERTIKRHIRYSLEEFGLTILNEGKSLGYNREMKANVKFDGFVRSYAERRSGQAIRTITSTSSKTIRRIVGEWVATAIEDGDTNNSLSKFINAEFEELTPAMSTRIARTEVAMASNNGALEAVRSLQIPNMVKEWVTANDDRVREGDHGGADHMAMNGVETGIDEKFTVPPDAQMDGPGDPSVGDASQVVNCRCVLVYKNRGEL